mmetsp:Transcript_35980/g.99144  ORF Transcript_35980/g.99144 Transcript_35980/m.99144 type:complete len:81 (+) Transcript_35980:399-641(+)
MEKVRVNGKGTSPVYTFLKRAAGKNNIEWNFATKFVVHCDEEQGTCEITRHDGMSSIKALKKAAPPMLAKSRKKKEGSEL